MTASSRPGKEEAMEMGSSRQRRLHKLLVRLAGSQVRVEDAMRSAREKKGSKASLGDIITEIERQKRQLQGATKSVTV